MRRIDEILIHCSATPEGRTVTAEDIRRWHTAPKPKGNGWRDIGYHFVILLDGTIQQGRPIELAGAHCTNHNRFSIGVCYIGGLSKNGKTPKDTRTEAQNAALKQLVQQLQQLYHIPLENIHGHKHYANKACPCFDVEQWKQTL